MAYKPYRPYKPHRPYNLIKLIKLIHLIKPIKLNNNLWANLKSESWLNRLRTSCVIPFLSGLLLMLTL